MRTSAFLLLLFASCAEPPKRAQYEQIASSIQYMHFWDPVREGEGHFAYDAAMGSDDRILHPLVMRLTDETPTAIHDQIADRTVKVGDVCFFLLLKRLNKKWQDFSDHGVFVSTQLPNPIFCIRWDEGARARLKAHLLRTLPPPEMFDP
jgi:hypothetical protein